MTITIGEGKDALTVHGMFVPYPEVEGREWEFASVAMEGKQYQALIIECGSFLRRTDRVDRLEDTLRLHHFTPGEGPGQRELHYYEPAE
jgi:hypothetical protein